MLSSANALMRRPLEQRDATDMTIAAAQAACSRSAPTSLVAEQPRAPQRATPALTRPEEQRRRATSPSAGTMLKRKQHRCDGAPR